MRVSKVHVFLFLTILLLILLSGCTNNEGNNTHAGGGDPYDIRVIVKDVQSDFWQSVIKGAEKADSELDNVSVTTDGPPTSVDIDDQIGIIENAISSQPDSIVLASTSSDASVSQFSKANEAGIEMIMIDTEVETDEYSTFIATNNVDAGAEAAEAFVAELESQNKDLEGEVAIISDLAGVQTLIDRNEGFVDRLEELAPDIKVMETRHADNDV